MALTGHTERMKMRGRANPRSILGHFHMSEPAFDSWPFSHEPAKLLAGRENENRALADSYPRPQRRMARDDGALESRHDRRGVSPKPASPQFFRSHSQALSASRTPVRRLLKATRVSSIGWSRSSLIAV
jgi:hypothetical protein